MSFIALVVVLAFIINPDWSWSMMCKIGKLIHKNWTSFCSKKEE